MDPIRLLVVALLVLALSWSHVMAQARHFVGLGADGRDGEPWRPAPSVLGTFTTPALSSGTGTIAAATPLFARRTVTLCRHTNPDRNRA